MYYSNGPSTTYVFSVANGDIGISMHRSLFKSIVCDAELSLQENSNLIDTLFRLFPFVTYSDIDPESNSKIGVDI